MEPWRTTGPAAVEPVPPAASLPPELAFLARGLVPLHLLHRAARLAARLAARAEVTAEAALLAEGDLSAERYYRHLAAFLRLPFAEHPLRPAADVSLADALDHGIVKLAPNKAGLHYLLAPRGTLLRNLIRSGADGTAPVAITSPERLEALVRQHRRGVIAHAASHGLPDWNGALSARSGLSARQSLGCLIVAGLFCLGAWIAPAACLDALALVFSLGFLLAVATRLAATAASPPPATQPVQTRCPDPALPIYTVVVPLFREAREVERLVASLGRLDYPRAKLDILLMVEANDPRTLDALDRLSLPACFRVVIAPAGHPQTKPRALNIALQFARGQFLVVYDAEDEPEPDQLRAAFARFVAAPGIACLQAKLAIDNSGDHWLTRLFTLEYAALFHVVNPGFAALGLPIPLGGTSNHFRIGVLRMVNGWDAWNVTEDIDLGIRLARFGHRVGTLDSITFEEAPNTLKAWLTQRRRWQKGWMVTLLTHSRHPLRTWRELGAWGGLAVSAMLFGTIVSCLLGPFCAVAVALRWWSGSLLHPHTASEAAWSTLSCFLITIGAASALWPALVGIKRRRLMRLAPWLLLLPVYLLLLSIAAWQAAVEMGGRPYFWAKTEHGRAKRRVGVAAKG